MWLALCGALLLLAFGSKVVSVGIRFVLFAVHKVGLFSNIRIDDRTTLQLTIQTVHIRVWRNAWQFVRSPTHHPLVTVDVAAVHVVVSFRDGLAKRFSGQAVHQRAPRCDHGSMWSELDTAQSLKNFDHPQWKQVRAWMHRLRFVWFFLPIVGVSVSDVEVDVVRDDSGRTTSIARLQKGNIAVQFVYKMDKGEIDLSVRVCPHESAVITLPESGVEATLRALGINVVIPVSRARENTKASFPSSLHVQCDEVGGFVDLITLVKDMCRRQSSCALEDVVVTCRTNAFSEVMLRSRGLLMLRLVELIPEVSIKICNIHATVVNGANKVGSKIDAIECNLRDHSKKNASFGRQQGQEVGEIAEERKFVVDIGHVLISSEAPTTIDSPPSSSISIDAVNIEVESRLAMCLAPTTANGFEDVHNPICLLWNTRCSGEVQGLSVALSDDLAPWVDSMHSLASPANSHSSTMSRNEDAVLEDSCSFWEDILAIEMQIQFKLLRTEVLCQARKQCCAVLPNGVPDLGLSVDEVVLFVHPFMDDDPLGVRAKADLQASRLKIFYAQGGRLIRTSFLSIDFVRVLIEPVCVLGSEYSPAEVEMDAEWLEVRWTTEAMHAIGGMLELGVVTLAPLLCEHHDWTNDEHWDPRAREGVPSMRPMSHTVEYHTASSEALKFRCNVKRSVVLFSHNHNGHNHVEYVTVDTLTMSVEEITGRFRLSVLDTKVCSVEGDTALDASFQGQHQRATKRHPSNRLTKVPELREQPTRRGKAGRRVRVEGSAFFCVKSFALEENKLLMCPMKVLDIFVDGVTCTWDMKTQERVVELIRRITFSAWEMLYRMRSAYGAHCTSTTSRYNRQGGLNGVVNNVSECDDAERLLSKLISASGDSLNRIHATNIDLQATFGNQKYLHLHVGLFESEDLPELWQFGNVTIALGESLKLLEVERVLVRHTVDKRRDYVFGFFEEVLCLRRRACGRLPRNNPRSDGMMIDIEGLRFGFSLQVDLVKLADAIQADIMPFTASHMQTFRSPWRPQEEIFYKFFFRTTNTLGQPRVWLHLSDVRLDCIDQPMEAWLEHVYPLWMEELAEQELRSQLLDEQITASKLTKADLLMSDQAINEMKTLLYEKSSRVYVHKVRRLQDTFRSNGQLNLLHYGTIMTVRIGSVAVDVFSEPNEQAVTKLIRGLDEATPAVDQLLRSVGLNAIECQARYALLLHQHLDVCVLDASVRMRSFPTPVAVIEKLRIAGHTIVAAAKCPEAAVDSFALTAAVRCFVDMNVSIERPVVFFGPAWVPTIVELAAIVERVMPSLILDVDRVHESAPWDIARRLLHGKLHLQVENAAVRLLSAFNTFQAGDYLEVGIQRLDVTCRRGEEAATYATIDCLTVKIEPDAMVNIAEITSLTLHSKATWGASRNASMHYILPVEYCKNEGRSSSEVFVVDFQEGEMWRENSNGVNLASRLSGYSGTTFSASVSGKIAPKTAAEQMTRRDIASRSAIVLYTKHVEWLIQFGRVYQILTQLKLPSRRRGVGNRATQAKLQAPVTSMNATLNRFLQIFKGVVIEEFGFIGLDVALYHSEKSQVGLRACINDKIAFSGSLNLSKVEAAPTNHSRPDALRHVSIEWNGFSFVIDNVALAVSDVQVRICTPATGSRGASLISIRDVCLNVGGGQSEATQPRESFNFGALHSELIRNETMTTPMIAGESSDPRMSRFKSSSISAVVSKEAENEVSRSKSKVSILEHFAIAQHNPFRYRDDNVSNSTDLDAEAKSKAAIDESQARTSSRSKIQSAFVADFRRQGFLLGLSATEIRVLVTLDTVATLVDIAENWIRVIRASLPELDRVPEEILKPRAGPAANAVHAAGMESPKKATSLADDPRFGPIFHASNPIPNNRTPSFSVDASNEANLPSPQSPGFSGGVVEPFLIVRFMDCQINFQDHLNNGSVLLALSRGTVRHSRLQEMHHELVDIKVDGVQLFTAPLDIDVRSRVIWLRTLEDGFTYCPSSFGLLKQVVAPIPAKVMIWIDRNTTVTNRVELSIPTVQIGVHLDSKNILEKLAMALVGVVTAKLAQYQAPDYSKMLQEIRGTQSHQASIQSSLQQLLLAKKQLKWKIAELHWRNACRWNYRATERASLAVFAAEGAWSHGALELDSVPSPFLHPHRLSSVSLSSSIGTSLTLTGSTAKHVESGSDELQRVQQQLDSIVEVVRSLVAAERLKHQPNPNLQLTFTLQSASLTLSATNSDIVSATMTKLNVKLKMYEDQSGTFALTIQDVCCRNLCPNTPYPELLSPLHNSKSWSGGKIFVRVDAEVAPPVNGTKIVRHFEINVHPLQVCVSYDLILQLVAFFTSVSGPTLRQEERKAEVRSQFLAAPQGSASGEGLLRKAVKVAGKAAHPLAHGLSRHRADSDHDQPLDPRVKAMQALQEEATQWISRVARADAAKPIADDDDDVTRTSSSTDKDVIEMRDRATNNILFKRIRLGTVEVMISFKNKKISSSSALSQQQTLEDMRGFEIKIHSLVYSDKTCSLMDLLLRIRRDVILDVLSQVGRNFTNVANFLRDQLDITRWGTFDALAPLKSLSTAIVGSGQTSFTASSSQANVSTSPSALSVDMLHQSPRVSHDASSFTLPSTPVDTSKIFQLELPENHPSRKKKQVTSQPRPSEPVGKAGDAIALPMSLLASDKADDDTPSPGMAASGKAKKTLSSFFGKSKKTRPTSASITEHDETAS